MAQKNGPKRIFKKQKPANGYTKPSTGNTGGADNGNRKSPGYYPNFLKYQENRIISLYFGKIQKVGFSSFFYLFVPLADK